MKYAVLSLLFLSSCAAQIEQKMKMTPMLSPEAQGGWPRIEMGAGYMSAPVVVVTSDVRYSPPDRSKARVVQQEKIFLHGGLGVMEKMDVTLDPASWFNLKYQFLGEPFTKAEKGNISLSGLASIWSSRHNDDGKDLSLAPDVKYTKESFSWRLGLIGGYRIVDTALIYTGISMQAHKYSGDYQILSPVSSGRYAGRADGKAVTLGIEGSIGKNFVVRAEDSYSLVKVPNAGARSSQHSFSLLLAGILGFANTQP